VAARGSAAQSEANLFQQGPEPARSMGVAFSQNWGLLGERFTAAVWLVATKTADPQIDDGLPTSNR